MMTLRPLRIVQSLWRTHLRVNRGILPKKRLPVWAVCVASATIVAPTQLILLRPHILSSTHAALVGRAPSPRMHRRKRCATKQDYRRALPRLHTNSTSRCHSHRCCQPVTATIRIVAALCTLRSGAARPVIHSSVTRSSSCSDRRSCKWSTRWSVRPCWCSMRTVSSTPTYFRAMCLVEVSSVLQRCGRSLMSCSLSCRCLASSCASLPF
mmetsp:Transcript_4344/g.10740  ORF Transcript_4344/g.10740 Transcript_4344/m.10740 type:complete len:210 (-) Transcript_4344:1060-1689(-)